MDNEKIKIEFKNRLSNAIKHNFTGGFDKKFLEEWFNKIIDKTN